MTYVYLLLAIVAEVIATTALKESQGFTRLAPSIAVVIGYSVAFYFLSLVLQVLPIGITYAIWAGLGIVLITLIGVVIYQQTLDLAAVIGLFLIILGIFTIQIFSNTLQHH